MGALSVVYAAVVMGVVMPWLGAGPSVYAARTWPFGGWSEVIWTAVRHPMTFLDYLRGCGRPFYAWQIVAPTGLLSLLSPGMAAVALPVLGFNIVSAFGYQHQYTRHYSLVLVPIVTAAAVDGLGRLQNRWQRSPHAQGFGCGLLIGVIGLTTYAWGLLPFRMAPPSHLRSESVAAELDAVARSVPESAVVSASTSIAARLAQRDGVYVFPNPFFRERWGPRPLDEGGCFANAVPPIEYVAVHNDLDEFVPWVERPTFDALRPRLHVVLENPTATLYRLDPGPVGGACPPIASVDDDPRHRAYIPACAYEVTGRRHHGEPIPHR